ncbi:hypothetical protein QBC44DRAFT_395973 [Cladorrhinum sp. PSN332]|nr:hypothetical protein QBC44DRAFT_395973 [Cladorrhinum sp. PSN332]
MLVKKGRVPVDHVARPFGTALQAASALRKHTTMKLLLEMSADPNFVGGCFGTAAQAASTHLGLEGTKHLDKAVNILRNKGAEFLWKFNVWTTAYHRAISQDLGSEYAQGESSLSWISKSYIELVRAVIRIALGPVGKNIETEKLSETLQLISTVRLERIRKLDILCEARVVLEPAVHPLAAGPAETGTANKELAQGIVTAVTKQVERTIKDQISTDIVSQISSQVSGVIADEVSRLVGQIERDLKEQIQAEVQRQLETQSVASSLSQRGWLAMFPGTG